VALEISDVAVPLLDDVELPGAHAIGAPGRYDHLGDRQLLSAADQQVVGRLPVKGAIGQEAVNATVHLRHHLRQDGGIGAPPGGQFRGDKSPRPGVHGQMQLAPGAALGGRLRIASFPARFDLDHPQPGAIDQDLDRSGDRRRREAYVQGQAPPRQRGVIRHRQVDAHQAEHRGHEAFGLAQRQVEDGAHHEHGLDGEVGVDRIPASSPLVALQPSG
jgi:hypothetical protein